VSIAITCNSGDGTDRGDFARRIFALLAPPAAAAPRAEPSAPPIAAEGVDVTALDLNSKAGLYFSERTGQPLNLAVQNGRLRAVGGPALVAQSKDRFRVFRPSLQFMSDDQSELQFLSPDQVELKSMEGQTTRYRRAQAYAPTADALKAFAGRYESKEIGAIFQVAAEGGGLVVRLEHLPAIKLELKPVDRDTFQFRMMFFRFQRDPSGKPMAIDYSNPVVRNIKFTRLADL
jgi:hypothetical protein